MIKTWKRRESDDEDEEEALMIERYGAGNRNASAYEKDSLYGHRYVVENMILAVKEGREPDIVPADAIKSVEIVCAMYESAKTGKTVYL